jgi:hypothetical protein
VRDQRGLGSGIGQEAFQGRTSASLWEACAELRRMQSRPACAESMTAPEPATAFPRVPPVALSLGPKRKGKLMLQEGFWKTCAWHVANRSDWLACCRETSPMTYYRMR